MSAYKFLEALLPYLKAALPITKSIELLGQQYPSLRKITDKVEPLIQRGHCLSLALEVSEAPKNKLPQGLLEWIQLGEETGEFILGIESALQIFKAKKLSQKTWIGILRYPVMILSFMLFAIFILNQTTLPALKKFYGDKPLPEISQLIFNHPILLSAFLILIPLMLSLFLWPFKKLQNQITLCQNLAIKLQAGIPLLQASPRAWQEFLIRGTPLSIVLEIQKQDKFLIQMAQLGEQTSTLPDSFHQAKKFYQARFDRYLERLQIYLPSILLIFMGTFVALLVTAIYLPLIQMDFS
jgi:type II secretory pathway component PulF